MRKLANCESVLVYKQLAVKVGLYEAIFLQQLHYRLQFSQTFLESDKWYQCKVDNWLLQLPFFTKRRLERTIQVLYTMKLIDKQRLDSHGSYYRIDYEVLQEMLVVDNEPKRRDRQDGSCYPPNRHATIRQNGGESTPKWRVEGAENPDASTAGDALRSKERIKEKIFKECNDVLLYVKAMDGQWGVDEGQVFQEVYDTLKNGADVVNMLTQVRKACQQQLTLYPHELFGDAYA